MAKANIDFGGGYSADHMVADIVLNEPHDTPIYERASNHPTSHAGEHVNGTWGRHVRPGESMGTAVVGRLVERVGQKVRAFRDRDARQIERLGSDMSNKVDQNIGAIQKGRVGRD